MKSLLLGGIEPVTTDGTAVSSFVPLPNELSADRGVMSCWLVKPGALPATVHVVGAIGAGKSLHQSLFAELFKIRLPSISNVLGASAWPGRTATNRTVPVSTTVAIRAEPARRRAK